MATSEGDGKPFRPRGNALKVWRCLDDEVLVDGVAGAGKTRNLLERALYEACRYPGSRILLVRKTRESMSESVLVTFEDEVLPDPHPARLVGGDRARRKIYRLQNGSELIVGGMDKASKIMSTDYDMIIVFEATELTEDDFESLTTRLRRGAMPFRQIVADCNPAAPSHWLKRRADSGRMTRIAARHTDNPVYWDEEADDWTAMGREYMARLGHLTGHRRDRLLKGLWAAAEGLVYPEFDVNVHVIDRFEIPPEWGRFITVDFGFRNAFVAQWWALDEDGRMYRYREIYMTERLVEDHAKQMAEHGAIGMPLVCDLDAEGRATLERYLSTQTEPARKQVKEGLQAVSARLRIQEDGKPRVMFLRDSLIERDRALEDAKLPTCTEEEFESYVYSTRAGKEELPVKENDHGVDGLRYGVMYLDGGDRYVVPAGERAQQYVPAMGGSVIDLPGVGSVTDWPETA